MDNLSTFYTYIPEPILRYGIRRLCQERLDIEKSNYQSKIHEQALISEFCQSPIALSTNIANSQHYQVPTEFFKLTLGPYLKYSCCLWNDDTTTLEQAENNMLKLYCERANLTDGMSVLDMGCGWGSLSLFLAKQYPNMKIVSLSNSDTQQQYIEQQISEHGLTNIQLHKADINDFNTNQKFDAIISIEMFEHVRNYKMLLERIFSWLNPDGICFVHHFCHKQYTYPFSSDESNSWMAKNFFTDGLMLSKNLLEHFQDKLTVKQQWSVNGLHYHKTCEAWLTNHKTRKADIIALFTEKYDLKTAKLQWKYWQIFFLACSELFAFNQGCEWFVQHYLFKKS